MRRVLLLGLLLACGPGAQRHEAAGIVRDVRPELSQVLIEHGDVPGLMPAMTMNFDVPDPALLARLERGQVIGFTIEFDGRAYRVVEARTLGRDEVDDEPGLAALAEARDPAPDFTLIDQDGAPVDSRQLRGRVLLVDFVYTHCPGPCPILTSRHVALQRELPPELRARTWFVSISVDPERDTPERLRAYADARGADLSHWSFLTGEPEALREVAAGYGVGSREGRGDEIDHVVATFLVDDEGRIAERFVGLEHGVEELLRSLERIASG